nr:ribonuclease H-like domain-containing protein [Tanacetum cinerariifolium]
MMSRGSKGTRNYHQLLPIRAEKVHQEKVQQEKLKAVKARLNFEEASQHSESRTPSRRRDLKKRLGSRRVCNMFEGPESRSGHSESPRKKGPERKTVFKRLKKGVFHRLGDKGKSMSSYSNDSRRRSYHGSRRDIESCYQSFHSRETEFVSENTITKGHPREGSNRCQKVKVAQEGIGSQSQRGTSRVLRTICPNPVGEVAASNRERKKSFPSWKQQEAAQKQNFKKGGFRNQQRPKRKQDMFTFLTKAPKEILALEKGKFKPPSPMTTLVEKGTLANSVLLGGQNPNGSRNHATGGTVTLRSSRIIPLECIMVLGPGMPQPVINQVTEEKIQNQNGPVSVTIDTNGMIKVLPLKTAEEVVARENERKARTTLLMALPEDHLAKFHKMDDAKETWEAIKSRFGTTASSSNTQNVAFVSADNTSSTNAINDDDMEEMNLKWQVAMISMRIKKFQKRTGRKLHFDTKDPVGFAKTKVKCFNCHKIRHFARDFKAKGNQDNKRRDARYNGNKAKDNRRKPVYQDDSKALVTIDGEDIDWSGHVEEDAQNYAMMAYSSSNSGSDYESVFMNKESDIEYTSVNDKYVIGMHVIPPHMTGNYMPSRPGVDIDYSKFTYGPKQTSVDQSDSKTCKYASYESDSSVETTTSMPELVENAPKDKEKASFAFTESVKHVKTSRENVKESDTPNHSPKLGSKDDPHRALKDKGIVNSGCSRHMIGNKAHLADYQEFKGGSITFGVENQANKSAGPKEANNSAEQIFLEELEKVKRQEKEANVAARKETTHENQDAHTNITNLLNDVSKPISAAGPLRAFNNGELSYPNDPSMPHLEDICASPSKGIFTDSSYDDEGVVTNFNNLETTVNVSPTPTTRIHTIHPKNKILGDPMSAIQTRSKANKNFEAHALVWILVDLPFKNKAIKTKWVYKNKKDKRGVVVRNKARLVAQGHRKEEGIDYDEVFTLVARIEAIRIFLVFASYMGFIVYQMDVKSAFLYGTIDKEVYVSQPPCFVDPKFPNKVYNVVKALYGLHQAPRGCVKTASTPIKTQKLLVKDEEAVDVDVYLYSSMIGSLMYFTASRPNIMFAGCACFRFKVTLKTSHLQAVKRIFRYLKGQPKLGLWYPKVSSFDLEAYSDSDYASANLDRKFTTGATLVKGKLLEATVLIKKANGVVKFQTLIDRKKVIDTDDVIRQALHLDDANGIECLPNEEIVTELARMGYEKPPPKGLRGTSLVVQWRLLSSALLQGRKDDVLAAATKEFNAAKPTMLHDEEVEQAAAREKKEKDDLEKAKEIPKSQKETSLHSSSQEEHDDIFKEYDVYKMEHFRGMTFDKVRPIFEMEYNKVQTLFKPDKDVKEPQKKRVAEETLLQESFKKLKAVEVSGFESTQDTPTNDQKEISKEDVQNMLKIIPVSEFKVEALQAKYPLIDWEIHFEGSRSYWKMIIVGGITKAYQIFKDMLKGFDREDLDALHDTFMLTEKNYPLSNGVMTLMLSAKLQVEEDSDMARDLVMKIFMKANKPKSRSTNGETSNLASKKANFSRSSFWNVESSSTSTTPTVEKIYKIERLIIDSKVTLVDDGGKPLKKVDTLGDHGSEDEVESVDNEMVGFLALKKVGYGTNSLLEQWKETYENADYAYDPYDDDMYEGQEIPNKIRSVTEHPDSESGKREFKSLIKFSEFTLQTPSGSNPSEDLSLVGMAIGGRRLGQGGHPLSQNPSSKPCPKPTSIPNGNLIEALHWGEMLPQTRSNPRWRSYQGAFMSAMLHKIYEMAEEDALLAIRQECGKDFKNTLKHKNEELNLIELGSHLHIEEFLKVQDSDKTKRNNVVGPLDFNMVEHNNSMRHLKKDYKGGKVFNKANGSGRNDLVNGSSNSQKGEIIHVFKDRCWFKTYKSLNDGSILHMGNESTSLVHGCGFVDLRFSSRKIISLFNVLHVPNIRKNLVSSSALNNCGYIQEQVMVSNQYFYCFNVEDDPKTFVKEMKSQDVSFQKEAINDEMDSMDVKITFLNGELDEEVYMNPPQGFNMLGNKTSKIDESGKEVIICLYVDDMLIFATDQV